VGRFRDTQTFVYLFHGTDDPVCGVQPDRTAAEQMLKNGNDFVYTELNGIGHGFPPDGGAEMAEQFEKKRLAVGRGRSFRRSDEIRSSFLEKPGPEEKKYLGDPEPPDPNAKAETAEAKRKRLLGDIDLGGGKADAAAASYAEFRDLESVKTLAVRLLNPKSPDDVRAAAAKALGNVGLPECLPHLERGLADENDPVFHAVLGALREMGDRKAGPALLRALDAQAKMFDGRRQGAAMDFPDFDARCSALGAASAAAAALSEPKEAVARIRDRVVKTVFENPPRVEELARAGMFPAVVRERLAKEVCAALAKTGHPSARDAILHLKEACRAEAAIVSACDEALSGLQAGG
jgi:HEAT repeat protein